MKLHNERTSISPITSLGRKMTHYKALFLHMLSDGIIIRPYMDTHQRHAVYSVIHKVEIDNRTLIIAHQLEIEIGRLGTIRGWNQKNTVCHCNFL